MTRVLVIDDEAPIRLLCRVNLEAEKMEVVEAKDGPTGLEEAKRTDPDVILLDVMMPMLDGWRVAEHLLDDPKTKDIPIIFLTARAEFRDRARGLDIGGIDYVTKPFNPLELASLVRNLLDRIERGERDDLRKREARRAARADGERIAARSAAHFASVHSPERDVAQPGRAPRLGRGSRRFESGRPDRRVGDCVGDGVS